MTEHFATLWIGTTSEPVEQEDGTTAFEHQVSDGPVGERGSSFDFTDAKEALIFALVHADIVIIEKDFKP